MTQAYDIIVFGGGVAGLYTANRLLQAGYNVILFEKDALGGTQTLASQGMIHGGQKYTLQGAVTEHASSIAAMPARWEACFAGTGDIDLSDVKALSETQVMFPAGSLLATLTTFAAAQAVRGDTRKLDTPPAIIPQGPVYELQEKVLDSKSLTAVLAKKLEGRIFKGEAQELLPDGQVAVNGQVFTAQAIIFTAGTGNENALKLMNIKEAHTQRRPLRQVMVRSMPEALFGHGIVGSPKPRVTITSHPDSAGGHVWYLGGNVAEEGATLSEEETLAFAKKEMMDIFPAIDWSAKEWATWSVDRAEAFDASGQLPPGPALQQRGKVVLAWPTKMTFAPALSDKIFEWLERSQIKPAATTAPPQLPGVEIGAYPWEKAIWQRL